ncbi:M20 family metallo-hydrolase [Breznakiella homolactica]|uniref:M20 family metallo-hydrolase n=1 Tax=Breznakiella homolactica TaxID=2798577 RepID=A0A7T7XN17_9SPIR|nr:M20 family metallo-hydrolase [Breznakiella homolactica]QQO09267.1 M20 family metallo-hydrolase [Breznakiella homolactica]
MKEKLFAFIDKSRSAAAELETELTKRPAVSPDSGGHGELDKCEFLEGWLKNHGITNLERHDAPDARAKGGIRPNLVATIPGKNDTNRLWIMSHLDVVPPGEQSLWNSDPWTVVEKDGKLIGRGVEDNQQGLTSSVLAALSLVSQGIVPNNTVKLLFVADEEMGSAYGIGWLMENRDLFRKDDMVLIPDGGDPKGESIEIAEKNLIWITFNTKGKQAHGSRPDLGANACLAGAELAVRLHTELNEKFSARNPLFDPEYSTFEPTRKEGNVPNINTIPGDDVFSMDMRILPQYPVKTVLAEIDRIKGEVEKKHGVSVSYALPQTMESKPTSEDTPLVKILSRVVQEVYGVKTKPIGIGGGTVGAYLRNADIPSVVWSRMDDTAHSPNEYCLVDNIIGDAKVMALLMAEER